MKVTFDLFNGDSAPLKGFTEWISGWWYFSKGLPVERGVLAGDEWLFVGWFFSEEKPADIIAGFRATSVETLWQADGEFILAIHSKSKNTVEIYRDRTGIFPVFYAQGKNGLAISFSKESVLRLTKNHASPSQTLLEQWPLYRVSIPPDTIIEEVKGLSGRFYLSITDKHILLNERPVACPILGPFDTLRSASYDLGERLSCAVKKRVKGQRNIGAWLSGGNDSSLIVALARTHYQGSIKTVFVTFESIQRDYRDYASQIADRFQTEHEIIEVGPKEYLKLWVDTICAIQSPINHPGTVGQTAAVKKLSGTVDVMLAGEGADTVFGGPYWAPTLFLSKIGNILPRSSRTLLRTLATNVQEKTFLSKSIAKGLRALGTPLNIYIHSENAFGDQETVDRVFGSGTWQTTITACQKFTDKDPLSELFYFHMLDWNPATVAAQMRLGFRYGLIFLFPFLDYDLMINCLRLPAYLRYHYSSKKAALKKYAEVFFDRRFIYKPKEGFGVPLGKWFSMPEFAPFLNLPLEERSLRRGWWNETELKKIIQLHKSGLGTDKSAESIPWITTNLELWARICIEGDSPDLYRTG